MVKFMYLILQELNSTGKRAREGRKRPQDNVLFCRYQASGDR
jgi:hypothetical protein